MARIIIVDDEPDMLAMMEDTLLMAGHEVAPAHEGRQAIQLYREKRADLVITDVFMPSKDGFEIIIELRKEFPDSLILAITGPRPTRMKTIEARITKNIKEDPSIEQCDIWNIQATFLDRLPDDATWTTVDPDEIGVNQLETPRTDNTRTAVTIRTQQKSRLAPGEVIHLGFR